MSLEYREIVRQHTTTRLAITSQTTDIGTLITNAQTAIITDNSNQTTTITNQLNAIQTSVDALQLEVSSAISVPSVLERPDTDAVSLVTIRYYNYDIGNAGIMADVPVGVPTMTLKDAAGNFVTNGAGGTSAAAPINDVAMVRDDTGKYSFVLSMDNPAAGSPNLDIGNFFLEIKVQENNDPAYSYHPRSFEVVELSGMEAGFTAVLAGIDDLKLGQTSIETLVNNLLGDPTAAATAGGSITGILDTLSGALTDLNTLVGTVKGINRSMQTVELMPFGAAAAVLNADPTKVYGPQDTRGGNGNEQVFVSFPISVPSSPQVSHALVGDVVEYDLVWSSIMNAGTGLSKWYINAADVPAGALPQGRAITADYSADISETFHAVQGEIKDALQDADAGWFLMLAGNPAGADSLTLRAMGETRVKFTYTTVTV